MAEGLDRQAVRRWLSDQRGAGERIAEERIQALLALTPERSLELYLELSESVPTRRYSGPSPPLQHWGEVRLTRDLDVTVLVPPEALAEFVEAALARFRPRIPEAREFALQHGVVLVETADGVPVDISLRIPGYEEEALRRAVPVEFPGAGPLRLLAPEDLILHKCVAGRPRDLEDVESILVRRRQRVDLALIRRWLSAFRGVVEGHDPLRAFEEALNRVRDRSQRAEGEG